eukprot:TRINITY_DN73872_c0_g1_i1.p3 TRINITY_DN73872_c0_g1~~TRINITY_DN73872_c0_g1_i1.p3  ORF type:complete len:189 (-),score=25.56 TRINITY_DN73872_c0_g1_i1:165-665(-)
MVADCVQAGSTDGQRTDAARAGLVSGEGVRDRSSSCKAIVAVLVDVGASAWAGVAERQRHLSLPPTATVGQARRCFGKPLEGDAKALVSGGGHGAESLGHEVLVDDATLLHEVARSCRVELSFLPAESPRKSGLGADLADARQELVEAWRSPWRVLRETWATYRPE